MDRRAMPRLRAIRLQTNALLWTSEMWATIPRGIRELVRYADISIDAASPATYRTNRRGGNFEKLLENLVFVASLRTGGPLEWLGISMVVQENNFKEMRDFVHLGKRLGADTVYFQQLVNWGTFAETEFLSRSIHRASHPRHGELREILQEAIFDDPVCQLGNLSDLRGRDREQG